MMAMQSYANKWWATVDEATRTDFQAIVTAFQAFYGGEDEAMAKAIAAKRTMKQSDEAMTSFGTRLLLEVTTIAKDNSQLQLNYVYGAVNTSVSEAVLPTRPKNILEAIGVAIEVEQNIRYSSFHSSNSTAKIPSAAKIWPPMGTESRGDDPMECDINAQQYRGGKSFQTKGNSNKSRQCFICERTNHVAEDCFLLKKAKALNDSESKEKKSKKNERHPKSSGNRSNNAQTAEPIDNGGRSGTESANMEKDITNHLFYKMMFPSDSPAFNHSQLFDNKNENLMPTLCGSSGDPTSFVLNAEVKNGIDDRIMTTKVLMDTGANISTISEEEVHRHGLTFVKVPPIKRTYGNSSSGISNEAVWIPCTIQNMLFKKFVL